MANVIKQIVSGEGDSQTIKMVVRDNERGPQGEQGAPGVAATITAGQAYAVPGGNPPAVINSGTSTNAVFDFYIPRTSAEWGDLTGNIENQGDLLPYLNKAASSVQPDDINYTVMSDLEVDSTTSTSNVKLNAAKVNLKSGATSSKDIPLPVASSTEAGVMNSSTFDTVADNATKINSILGGMVAIAGLPSTPTQAQLTTAWQTATGLTTAPTNNAKILDVDNSKYWTYYTNTSLWYHASADIQASVAPFTNSTDGTIKGSTNVGQIFAESDGTGSVNGWDTLSSQVSNNADAITTINNKLTPPFVDTADIRSGAVTVAKMADSADAATISTATVSSVSSSYKTIKSYNVTSSGLYFVSAYITTANGGSSEFSLLGQISNGSTVLEEGDADSIPNYVGNHFSRLNLSTVEYFASGNTINAKARVDNKTISVTCRLRVKKLI